MKTQLKNNKKKYPYKKVRPLKEHNIFAQIRNREQRKTLMLPNYAIIDKKGNIIEKYRLKWTANQELPKLQKDYFQKLKIIELNE